jgi:hypothetical protein
MCETSRVKRHDVNAVMMLGLFIGPESLERPALHSASTGIHFSQRKVMPSLVAPRSGSPRNTDRLPEQTGTERATSYS